MTTLYRHRDGSVSVARDTVRIGPEGFPRRMRMASGERIRASEDKPRTRQPNRATTTTLMIQWRTASGGSVQGVPVTIMVGTHNGTMVAMIRFVGHKLASGNYALAEIIRADGTSETLRYVSAMDAQRAAYRHDMAEVSITDPNARDWGLRPTDPDARSKSYKHLIPTGKRK